MSYKGTIEKQLVRNETSFVHGQGWSTLHEYHGGERELEGILWDYVDHGWEVNTTREGPYMRFTATRAGDEQTAATDYYDKFSINKETLQKSIWTLPEVIVEMDGFAGSGLGAQLYRHWIEEAIDTGDQDTLATLLPPGGYDAAWGAYRELCRGADSYETEYIVLTRERVVSMEYFQTDVMPIPALNAQLIYTSTAALQNAFSIPDLEWVTWPDATPPAASSTDTAWGWRSRRREIRYQEGARVEIVQDWAWAEWSTNLYTVYGT